MNVLFTSVGRRVELLRGFRKSMRELDLNGKIIALDIDPLAPALSQADVVYMVPRVSDPAFVEQLKEICSRESVDLVFPLIDPDIPVLASHRDEIASTGARVVVIPERSVRLTADKALISELFTSVGVPTPRMWSIEDATRGDLDYPLFLKPRFGSAGQGAVKISDRSELDFHLDRTPDPLIQEFLPGPEITSDVLCDLEGEVLAVVSRKRIEVRSGEVSKGVTVYDPEIVKYCAIVARALDAVGPITVQCILRDGQPYFTEVNARLGGGVPLGIAAGVDSPKWLLGLVAGRRVDIPPIGSYRTGLYMTRYDESLVLTEAEHAGLESRRLRP